MKVGFTGPRKGINPTQLIIIKNFLIEIKSSEQDEFHHGDCVGADEQVFEIARELKYRTFAHPCSTDTRRAFTDSDVILPIFPALIRNHHIVDISDTMIAAPDTNFEILRSGTWATIRYARTKGKINEDRILYPRLSV